MNKQESDSGFWKIVERFKIIGELIAALIVIVPILFVLVQQGLAATVPAWLVLLITLSAVTLGYLLGRRPRTVISAEVPATQPNELKTPLQTINFNYQDSPLNHGWRIAETVDESQPVITHVSDGFYGNALKIRSTARYALDCGVIPAAHIGKSVEFVAKMMERDSSIYAKLSVQSKDGTKTKDVWLNFQIGVGQPRPHGDGMVEWIVYVSPELIGSGWLKFQVDLNDALVRSFGKDGWDFRKLRGFRLRGSLNIAYIKIC